MMEEEREKQSLKVKIDTFEFNYSFKSAVFSL